MAKTMRKPTTPGEMLNEEFLIPSDISQTAFAKHIGVDFKTINRVVMGADLSPELAMKVAAATNTSVEFWLNLQASVTVWKLNHSDEKLPKPMFDFGGPNASMMMKTRA